MHENYSEPRSSTLVYTHQSAPSPSPHFQPIPTDSPAQPRASNSPSQSLPTGHPADPLESLTRCSFLIHFERPERIDKRCIRRELERSHPSKVGKLDVQRPVCNLGGRNDRVLVRRVGASGRKWCWVRCREMRSEERCGWICLVSSL